MLSYRCEIIGNDEEILFPLKTWTVFKSIILRLYIKLEVGQELPPCLMYSTDQHNALNSVAHKPKV